MILCGTDLSMAAESALQAAGALARKLNDELLLVAVVEGDDTERAPSPSVQLETSAAALRHHFDIPIETLTLRGVPERKLLAVAKERAASLIVVGARGGARHAHRLGSVAEHLCQHAEVPVFVARSADNLVSWSRGQCALQVLVGSGLGDTSRSALECVADWPELKLTVAHVAWPFGEHYRLGISGPMPLDHLRPEVHHQLLGELGRWVGETHCRGPVKLDVSPGYGRIDHHLAHVASQKEADLLVVGTHQRNLASRLWQGSVSRSAIHEADCSVLCVPQGRAKRTRPAPRTVLIPTDFSALADRAVAQGYSLVGRGGSVHLVHVVESLKNVDRATLEQQLLQRMPEDAGLRGVTTERHVLEGSEPWLAIWQYGSRCNADIICMATHSRDAVKSLVIGSQAQALLQHSRVPVLLVPPDRES